MGKRADHCALCSARVPATRLRGLDRTRLIDMDARRILMMSFYSCLYVGMVGCLVFCIDFSDARLSPRDSTVGCALDRGPDAADRLRSLSRYLPLNTFITFKSAYVLMWH
jgi:hypothetical protein